MSLIQTDLVGERVRIEDSGSLHDAKEGIVRGIAYDSDEAEYLFFVQFEDGTLDQFFSCDFKIVIPEPEDPKCKIPNLYGPYEASPSELEGRQAVRDGKVDHDRTMRDDAYFVGVIKEIGPPRKEPFHDLKSFRRGLIDGEEGMPPVEDAIPSEEGRRSYLGGHANGTKLRDSRINGTDGHAQLLIDRDGCSKAYREGLKDEQYHRHGHFRLYDSKLHQQYYDLAREYVRDHAKLGRAMPPVPGEADLKVTPE